MKTTPHLLLIDVSDRYSHVFARWASEKGVEVVICDRNTVPGYWRDTVLCVYQSFSGEDIVSRAHNLVNDARPAPLVILSPEISIAKATQIIEAGVRDVIRIPAPAEDVLARAALRARRMTFQQSDQRLVGVSSAIQRVRRELCAVSAIDSTVLITGETGTGKGLAARLIHELSPRRHRPFVQSDCSGLSGSLIESELFGHERGAFTGAIAPRVGRFEAAALGTIFLDEVGELSLALQAKLLRVLQDQVFERVGSNRPRTMSARIIAATNVDLESAVTSGRFRRDLFFRLNVIRIEIPPLRERLDDLPILIQFLLGRIAERLGVGVPPVEPAFMSQLACHDWPGNVRELLNVLERYVVRHQSGLLDGSSTSDLIGHLPRTSSDFQFQSLSLPWSNRSGERRFLEAELAAAGGNISKMARKLGIARSTLRYRISLHKIQRAGPQD